MAEDIWEAEENPSTGTWEVNKTAVTSPRPSAVSDPAPEPEPASEPANWAFRDFIPVWWWLGVGMALFALFVFDNAVSVHP